MQELPCCCACVVPFHSRSLSPPPSPSLFLIAFSFLLTPHLASPRFVSNADGIKMRTGITYSQLQAVPPHLPWGIEHSSVFLCTVLCTSARESVWICASKVVTRTILQVQTSRGLRLDERLLTKAVELGMAWCCGEDETNRLAVTWDTLLSSPLDGTTETLKQAKGYHKHKAKWEILKSSLWQGCQPQRSKQWPLLKKIREKNSKTKANTLFQSFERPFKKNQTKYNLLAVYSSPGHVNLSVLTETEQMDPLIYWLLLYTRNKLQSLESSPKWDACLCGIHIYAMWQRWRESIHRGLKGRVSMGLGIWNGNGSPVSLAGHVGFKSRVGKHKLEGNWFPRLRMWVATVGRFLGRRGGGRRWREFCINEPQPIVFKGSEKFPSQGTSFCRKCSPAIASEMLSDCAV